MLSDTHIHTRFSTDSEADPYAILLEAKKKGLDTVCFTDHYDLDFPGDNTAFVFSAKQYFSEYIKLQERAANEGLPRLLLGIEMGQKPGRPDLRAAIDDLLSFYPFDYVIGSTHIVEEKDPYEREYWDCPGDRLALYFETLLTNIKEHDSFDSCGHLDYVIRYLPSDRFPTPDYTPADYRDYWEELLRSLIERGKALEINTGGYRKNLSFFHPKDEILKRYRELGGELITFGSDAHKPEDVGADILAAASHVKDLGFRYYAVYKNRKPEMLVL